MNLVLSKKQESKKLNLSELKCKLCDTKFASAILQQTHFIEQNIFCKDCKKCHYADTEDGLDEDQCAEHNIVIDKFRCEECIFSGKNETGLKIHMAAKHKDQMKLISG